MGSSAAPSVAAISRISATHRHPFSSAWRAAWAERSGSEGIECSHSRTRASSTPYARAASRMVSRSAAVPFVQPA